MEVRLLRGKWYASQLQRWLFLLLSFRDFSLVTLFWVDSIVDLCPMLQLQSASWKMVCKTIAALVVSTIKLSWFSRVTSFIFWVDFIVETIYFEWILFMRLYFLSGFYCWDFIFWLDCVDDLCPKLEVQSVTLKMICKTFATLAVSTITFSWLFNPVTLYSEWLSLLRLHILSGFCCWDLIFWVDYVVETLYSQWISLLRLYSEWVLLLACVPSCKFSLLRREWYARPLCINVGCLQYYVFVILVLWFWSSEWILLFT